MRVRVAAYLLAFVALLVVGAARADGPTPAERSAPEPPPAAVATASDPNADGFSREEDTPVPTVPPAAAGLSVSSAPAPADGGRRSLIASMLQAEPVPGAAEEASARDRAGSGFNVRWSGSGELLWWGRIGGTFRQGIFAERTENSQFKATHFHGKLSASLGRRGSAYIEACFTHPRVGTQAEQAWVEYNASDYLNLQGGRILVPFGLWNLIHDVYDHPTISYPLPYVGHEETEVELLGGPAPIVSTGYSDIGAMLYGSVWVSGNDQVWYGGYAVNGRFGTRDIEWLDLWNNQEDNNSNKALGGRIVYSRGDNLSLGVSGQAGRFDPDNRLRYRFGGVDLYYRFANRYNLRAEWIRNPVDSTVRGFTKTGWYVMFDFPFSRDYQFVAMVSGLRRSPAQRIENLTAYTIGVNRRLTSNLKLKTELNYLRLGNFIGDPDNEDDARFGTRFDDVVRVKASLVAIF